MRTLLLGLMFSLVFSSCTRYQMTTTKVLDDLGVKYEFVDELEHHPDGSAEYNFEDGVIYFVKGKYEVSIMFHELAHLLRHQAGVFGDRKLEEIIAVKAGYRLGKLTKIGSGMAKWEIPGVINRTLAANGFTPERLSDQEREYIKEQVKATEDIFTELLKEKGYSVEEIDWLKTAILILI